MKLVELSAAEFAFPTIETMLASLHITDSMQQQEELTAEPDYTEFNIFRDYFGLYTIVKSLAAANAPPKEDSPVLDNGNEVEMRARRDSLGSSTSDFSSNSLESVEVADICYNYSQDVRARQAFSEVDVEPLSPLGGGFESSTKTNIPPSLFLNHSKLHTINTQPKKPQVSHAFLVQ